MAYRTGILAWYDCPISTGKVEGINNKIKVMKRIAYDFRGEKYFHLRLYALHDCRITPNAGGIIFTKLPYNKKSKPLTMQVQRLLPPLQGTYKNHYHRQWTWICST